MVIGIIVLNLLLIILMSGSIMHVSLLITTLHIDAIIAVNLRLNNDLRLGSLSLLTASLGGRRLLGYLAGGGVGSAASLGLLALRRGCGGRVAVATSDTPLFLDLTETGCGGLAVGEARLLSNKLPVNL